MAFLIIMNLDLRLLECFVAAVDDAHYAPAAQRLGMAPARLRRSIRRLEASLDAQLLVPRKQRVTLTPAGTTLLEQARRLLVQADTAKRAVRRVASGTITKLKLGVVPWSAMQILPQAIHTFRKQCPGVKVRIDEQLSQTQVEALQSAQLDLGIINCGLVDTDGLELRSIERTRLVAAVPSRWPVAARGHMRLAELAELPLVLMPHNWLPNYYAALKDACRKAGFKPKVAQEVRQSSTLFNLVANEFGVGLVQDATRHLSVDGVTLVEITDLPDAFSAEIALAWMPGMVSAPLQTLIDLLLQEAAAAVPEPLRLAANG